MFKVQLHKVLLFFLCSFVTSFLNNQVHLQANIYYIYIYIHYFTTLAICIFGFGQRDYYNTTAGPFEQELQLVLGLWSARNQQNQQLSGQQIPTFPCIGTVFDTPLDFVTPPIIRQCQRGNPRMCSNVTNSIGSASSSATGMAFPQSANVGTSLQGAHRFTNNCAHIISLGSCHY